MTEPAQNGVEILQSVDAERIRDLRRRGKFFWLDLAGLADTDLNMLSELVTIHPSALEDTREFGQRAKLDDYQGSALLVFYGVESCSRGRPRVVEVHLHISGDALVTVPREPLTALAEARRHVVADPGVDRGHLLYRVLGALAGTFLDSLEGFDDAIDSLQEALVEHPNTVDRRRIFDLRRHLVEMHQVVIPQCDLLASSDNLFDAIPALDRNRARDQFRDVHDHLARAAGLIGSYREQLASLLDLYISEVSNRLNETMKRLAFIATVFLPLTFITGFFGMNFGWLLNHITPLWTFLVFGLVLLIGSAAAVVLYLRRTGLPRADRPFSIIEGCRTSTAARTPT